MTPKFIKSYFNFKNIAYNLHDRPGLSHLLGQLNLVQIQYYLEYA